MNYFFFFFCLLLVTFPKSLCAQKKLFKEYDVSDTHSLYIESDAIFKIKLTTSQTDKIAIYTQIDGETYESTLLHTEIVDGVLKVTTGRTPDFIPFNDKLSAHKILSIVLEITLPEGFTIDIYSTLASVEAQGNYNKIRANLGSGGCYLSGIRFRESVYINTISGNIELETKKATIQAQSRNGTIVIPKGMTGIKIVRLQSIDGDITVINSQ
ncbi:hypothetical protein [uncultured Dokdonia sp.]|uniref:hypothetical protein n=1 Tax=uncultured Dokdonia sp. TaxID=575653 RepID=UPI0026017778|nr:hypothetical protein [uncultured Dokdonia sp.]